MESSDIYNISERAGTILARKYGTSLRSHWEFDYTGDAAKYSKYALKLGKMEITYGPIVPQVSERYAHNFEHDNGSSIEQEYHFSVKDTYQNQMTWRTEETLKVGSSVTVKAGVPFIGEAEMTAGVELTVSSAEERLESRTKEFTSNVDINIPPHKTVYGEIYIELGSGSAKYTAKGKLEGHCAFWFNDKIALNDDGDYHWLWFVPISEVLRINVNNNFSITGFGWNSDGSCFGQATGTLLYSLASKTITKVHEKPYIGFKQEENVDSLPVVDNYQFGE